MVIFQVGELYKLQSVFEKNFGEIQSKYDVCRRELSDYQVSFSLFQNEFNGLKFLILYNTK